MVILRFSKFYSLQVRFILGRTLLAISSTKLPSILSFGTFYAIVK